MDFVGTIIQTCVMGFASAVYIVGLGYVKAKQEEGEKFDPVKAGPTVLVSFAVSFVLSIMGLDMSSIQSVLGFVMANISAHYTLNKLDWGFPQSK